MFRPGSDNIEDLQRRVRKGVSKLRGLEIEDELALEVLAQLVEGRKTAAELVERTYGVTSSDTGYKSSYGKVWRVINRLESKGLVSRKLFGKDKPYRLTELAVVNLARIGEEKKQIAVVSRLEAVFYLTTIVLSIPILSLSADWLNVSDPAVVVLFACFFYLLGVSTSRVITALRRVF